MRDSELYIFMKQLQTELASEYKRIRVRAKEDPGTAGDESEANWAELLRSWLPSNYHIVTKGRIISHEGIVSPQVDVLVLHPAYPRHLINKKHYLAGGVVAAFECKLSLKAQHLSKAFKTCSIIKNLLPARHGTPYQELQQPILFGLIAHSQTWKGTGTSVAFNILDKIICHQYDGIDHPRNMMDVICIADTATYRLSKSIYIGPNIPQEEKDNGILKECGIKDGVGIGYVCCWEENDKPYLGTILGNLVSDLIIRLAYEDPSLRSIAEFYRLSDMDTGGISRPDLWEASILSEATLRKLRKAGTDDGAWSEWAMYY